MEATNQERVAHLTNLRNQALAVYFNAKRAVENAERDIAALETALEVLRQPKAEATPSA